MRSDDDDTDNEGKKKEGVARARANAKEANIKQEKKDGKLIEQKINGIANGSARIKVGESYADAIKEEKKIPSDKKRR